MFHLFLVYLLLNKTNLSFIIIVSCTIIFVRLIGLVGRVFANGRGDQGPISGRVIPKTKKKWYLMPPCLTVSIIRYVSRVMWSNPGIGVAPSLHLGVVAIEKGAFGSPLTTIANFTYLVFNKILSKAIVFSIKCVVSCCKQIFSGVFCKTNSFYFIWQDEEWIERSF